MGMIAHADQPTMLPDPRPRGPLGMVAHTNMSTILTDPRPRGPWV